MHSPRVSPPHSLPDSSEGHACTVQSSPFHPLWHVHRPLGMQVPWPEQLFAHVGSSQTSPAQPSSHLQLANTGGSSEEKRFGTGRKCGAVAEAWPYLPTLGLSRRTRAS